MPEPGAGAWDAGQGGPLDGAGPAAAWPGVNERDGAGPGAGDQGGAVLPEALLPDATLQEGMSPEAGAGESGGPVTAGLAEIAASVSRLAISAELYHERARQREGVIEYLRDELDLLRRGERRSLLRPLLTAVSRLHADLVLQSRTLPEDYDAQKASRLLVSFAETVAGVLGDAGIITYAPAAGDPFDPRRHRKVKGEPTTDPALDGMVAAVRKDGYLDIEADSLLAPAEVTLYTTGKDKQ